MAAATRRVSLGGTSMTWPAVRWIAACTGAEVTHESRFSINLKSTASTLVIMIGTHLKVKS